MTNTKQNTNESTNPIEEYWVKEILPHKISTLPYDKLSAKEQNIIDKIGNGEEISEKELSIIKKTTAQYSEALEKYDAEKIIESNEQFKQTIINEEELLNLVDEQQKPKEILMNVEFDSCVKQILFKIQPIDDSRAVKMTQLHMDVYQNLSDEETRVLQKNQRGKPLSQAEQDVIEHINKKIQSEGLDERMEQINHILASQVTPPSKGTLEERKKFWSKFPFNEKMSLYLKVEEKLGLNEKTNSELFPNE